MFVIILQAVPLHLAGGGGCEQVNPSLSEESPAFPDMMKDTGDMEQIYCVQTEDTGSIEQIYCIKTDDAGPIEQIYCIETEEERYSIKTEEQIDSIKTEDVELIEHRYSIKIEEVTSAERDHHSLHTQDAETDDASSAEEDVTIEKRTLETNFKMPEEVCILMIYSLSVYYFLTAYNDTNSHYYHNVCFRLVSWMKTLLLPAHHLFLESNRITFSQLAARQLNFSTLETLLATMVSNYQCTRVRNVNIVLM